MDPDPLAVSVALVLQLSVETVMSARRWLPILRKILQSVFLPSAVNFSAVLEEGIVLPGGVEG
jgi:hypothetical protein